MTVEESSWTPFDQLQDQVMIRFLIHENPEKPVELCNDKLPLKLHHTTAAVGGGGSKGLPPVPVGVYVCVCVHWLGKQSFLRACALSLVLW